MKEPKGTIKDVQRAPEKSPNYNSRNPESLPTTTELKTTRWMPETRF
jgi:hypothetical protein